MIDDGGDGDARGESIGEPTRQHGRLDVDPRGGSEVSLGAHPGLDVEGDAHGVLRVFADEDAVVSEGDVGARDDA